MLIKKKRKTSLVNNFLFWFSNPEKYGISRGLKTQIEHFTASTVVILPGFVLWLFTGCLSRLFYSLAGGEALWKCIVALDSKNLALGQKSCGAFIEFPNWFFFAEFSIVLGTALSISYILVFSVIIAAIAYFGDDHEKFGL